jgi:hypothetical protein
MREAPRPRYLRPAAAGFLCLAAIAPGIGSAAVRTSVGVQVLPTSQQAILAGGKIKAQVRTGVPGSVKITPMVQLTPAGSKPVRIGKPRRVRFEEPGSATIKLPLRAAGRGLISNCSQKTLVVTARLKAQGAEASGAERSRAVATVPLLLDSSTCGGAAPSGGGAGGGGGDASNGNVVPPATPYTGPPIDTSNADRCDFLDPAICLQPWPNDYFTVPDQSTDTDRRINLHQDSMPANTKGVHIDPAEYNRNDGFSPGNTIIARIPGLDSPQALEATGAVPIDDIGAYDDPDQPVVVINAETGQRHPIWAEIDFNPIDPATGGDVNDAAKINLIIRPAVNFEEGARYVVALRGLKDAQNNPIQPTDAFRVYRDNLTTEDDAIESRRPHMEELFETLGQAGIQRSGLYLTWDFTVASERNISGRALKIRDDAFAQLGDTDLADGVIGGDAPAFTIDDVQDFTPAEDDRIRRIVMGHVTVPCYMNAPGCPPAGATYNYTGSSDGLPTQLPGNTADVAFECLIPHSAVSAGAVDPARPSLYGHGLLGSFSEVEGGNIKSMANEHNFVFCATDWYGFATTNAANILAILQDLSQFPLLADETQQGFLNFLYLGRLMIHPDGLASDDAFRIDPDEGGPADASSVIDTEKLFYDGNSQGGILGGSLTALAPDFERGVLGVPGMNYSTLLTRSVDFEPYAEGKFTEVVCDELPEPFKSACNSGVPQDSPFGLYDNYPNELERPLIFSLIQMLWDRAEANGYAHHMTSDPLPNTPPHEVLLHAAFGDHQVANVAAEVEARTIGASVYQPALEAGRHWEADGASPLFGIPSIPAFPFGGSALIYWDGGPVTVTNPDGTATPPNENIPPRPPAFGSDPHSYPRNDIKARAQKSDFLQVGGQVRNYCTTANSPDPLLAALFPETGSPIPCHAHGWTGP